VLAGLGRYEEALAAADEAVRIMPDHPLTAIQRGTALQWCGRYDEAFTEYDRAIALNPSQAEAWVEKAMLTMLLGDLATGFALYEWRWRTQAWDESPRRLARGYTKPLWLGETAIAGKTILVYAEQGYGDAIHFCRYATLAANAGARVIVETNPPLKTLMTTLPGVSQVIADTEPQPDHDLRCPMMSMPLAFATTAETIPGDVPYLRADPMRSAKWRDRLSGLRGRRVGLIWGSGAAYGDAKLTAMANRKSLPLAALAPLGAIAGLAFISLQLGPPAAEAASPPSGLTPHDYTADLRDFADTAALMDNLDLVISVCTSTAHLAGALGKPVWLLNRFDTAWQWMLDREDSPWYPTMRIFRQPSPGDWDTVVRAVEDPLRVFAAT
jgi:tetratricopeptide (TPR) repeat protein